MLALIALALSGGSTFILLTLLLWASAVVPTAYIAHRRGRSPAWGVLGLVIGWFAIAVAVLLPRRGTAAAAT